jgi:hypothetical protein
MKMNKKILGMPLALFLVAILMISGATAALLSYYTNYKVTATVEQSVVFSDDTTTKTKNIDVIGGDSDIMMLTLKNRANVDADVKVDTTCDALITDCVGVTTNHYSIFGFEDTQGTTTSVIEVTDLGDKVEFKITTNVKAIGHDGFGLIIGDSSDVKYQIHNNDGSDASFAWGTPLISPYDTTLVSGCEWNGWHSSCVNTEVSDLDWVTVTGDRYFANNPDGIFIITVDKTKLGFEDFKYVVYMTQDAEFSDPGFSWSTPSVNDMHVANVGNEITNVVLTIPSQGTMDFIVNTKFDVSIIADTFEIETKVIPQ